ncbi:MAG: hypothetical protein ACE5DI_01800 [Candidatus Micrarchaeia archaeon]
MVDFTFLFLLFLMLFALQTKGLELVAIALFVILFVVAKSKHLMIALGLVALVFFLFSSGVDDPLVLGGLLLAILVLIVKKDSDQPSAQGYYPAGMQ